MGRPKRMSGHNEIANAQKLFERSQADGKPDYRYVALAIGASPGAPPDWAMLACIELRSTTEHRAARGIANDIEFVLDEVVRLFDLQEQQFEQANEHKDGKIPWGDYKPPSLRAAILFVLEEQELRRDRAIAGNDDWFDDIREAWDWEQTHDRLSIDGLNLSLRTFYPTHRIDRVMNAAVAEECHNPVDTDKWAWITQRLSKM